MTRLPWTITAEMFLSETEVERLLARVRGTHRSSPRTDHPTAVLDRVIIELLLFSGLRTSECCGLKLADTPAGHDASTIVVHGRLGASRTVYIPRWLSDLTREFASQIRPQFLPVDVRPDDLELPWLISERGRPFNRTGLYRRVKRILTDAGLGERASVQLLRHTYGFLAYKRTGGNLLFVQRQLGHAHPMITSVYAQLVDESYEDLAELPSGLVTAWTGSKPRNLLAPLSQSEHRP
ncbi:MAG: site-specific integrase [Phycisphaerae bacterium]|nr:site-specific integrase [Phycisphaerae bacterium]